MFPPLPLARVVVAKAQQDQAHGIAILPCSHTAAWWHTAIAASRTTGRRNQPFHRIRASPQNVSHHIGSPLGRLAVFHFDFWLGDTPRPSPCPHGHLARPPDLAELTSIAPEAQAFLAALNTVRQD